MAEADADSAPQLQQQSTTLSRWTPSMPTSLIGMLNPFSTDDSDKSSTPNANAPSHTLSKKRQSFLASLLPTASPAEPPPSPDKDDTSIMFSEPDTHSNSDDASREGSVDECGRRASKKGNRPKTCYSICHPAPSSSTRQKLHRRPRSLLQLHKLSPSARPRPAYEVVPSANFSVRLTRAITKVFKTKHGLCPNDLVVMKAEKYATYEADEEQEARDIVALICKGRKEDGASAGKAKICLPNACEWEAYPTLNGGYEFFSTDEHGLGLTVRWVPKRNKDGSKPTDSQRRKFNFSTISPNSRKHPVIATLSRTQLDVNDTYKMPDPAAATPLSTPRHSTILTDAMEEEQQDGQEQCQTDDRLREIIVMTGIWVAFKEGWSPNFKYDDKDKENSMLQRSPSMQHSPAKSATFSSPMPTPPASPSVATPTLEKRNSIKSVVGGASILRNSSLLRKGNRSSTASAPEIDDADLAAQVEKSKKSGRARSDSTSTVLVHRAASNRAKHHHATWRPDLLDAQREMPESSGEDTPARRGSVAQPILPSASVSGSASHEGSGSEAGEAVPRSVGAGVEQPEPEKRESSTTTATTSTTMSEALPRKAPAKVSPSPRREERRKKSGWRRLLCGSGQDI